MRKDFYDRLAKINKKFDTNLTTEDVLHMMNEHLSFSLFMDKTKYSNVFQIFYKL